MANKINYKSYSKYLKFEITVSHTYSYIRVRACARVCWPNVYELLTQFNYCSIFHRVLFLLCVLWIMWNTKSIDSYIGIWKCPTTIIWILSIFDFSFMLCYIIIVCICLNNCSTTKYSKLYVCMFVYILTKMMFLVMVQIFILIS